MVNALETLSVQRIVELLAAINELTGADAAIDRKISEATGLEIEDFSSSIDAARALVELMLPEARLHLGYGVTGLFPSATVSGAGCHAVREAPTVPLAILRSLFQCLSSQ